MPRTRVFRNFTLYWRMCLQMSPETQKINKLNEIWVGTLIQHIFILFPLSLGYLFYYTCVDINYTRIVYQIWPTQFRYWHFLWMLKYCILSKNIFFQNPIICCTFVGVYQIFSIYMIRLQLVPFLFFVINVVLTICCVWWVCFCYREQQTIVIFAKIDDRIWRSRSNFEVLIFQLVYGRGTCFWAMLTAWTFQHNIKSTK